VETREINVLLAQGDPDHLGDLQDTLGAVESPRLRIEGVRELSEALERLSRGGIDVVLLDLDLPDSQGVVTFERTAAFAPEVPVVVLSDRRDGEHALRAVRGGAQDYLVRQEITTDLVARSLRYAIERHRLLSALRNLSLVDDLTELYNRDGFLELGDQFLRLTGRSSRETTLIVLDLDRFKTINDSFGHHVGDRALMKVAEILRATFRHSDLMARLEADRFAVLAPEAPAENADRMIERVRDAVDTCNEGGREPYWLSLRFAVERAAPGEGVLVRDLLHRAEASVGGRPPAADRRGPA